MCCRSIAPTTAMPYGCQSIQAPATRLATITTSVEGTRPQRPSVNSIARAIAPSAVL